MFSVDQGCLAIIFSMKSTMGSPRYIKYGKVPMVSLRLVTLGLIRLGLVRLGLITLRFVGLGLRLSLVTLGFVRLGLILLR